MMGLGKPVTGPGLTMASFLVSMLVRFLGFSTLPPIIMVVFFVENGCISIISFLSLLGSVFHEKNMILGERVINPRKCKCDSVENAEQNVWNT